MSAGITTIESSPAAVRRSRAPSRWGALALVLTAIAAWLMAWDVIPWLRGPAPFPPEWEWPYEPLDWARTGSWIHLFACILYPCLVLAVMHPTLLRWRSERTRRNVAIVLAVLFFLGLQMALASARKGHLLELILFRTYAPPGNGYFMTAVRADDIWSTIHNYATAMLTFPHDRPQTHPPGIFMYYAVSNFLFERLPAFSQWFAPIARSWAPEGRDWIQLNDAYVTSAFFSGVGQWLTACLAPIGFYAFLRRLDRPPVAGVSAYALWGAMLLPLLASISSFYSHWDVNYLLVATAAWFFGLRGQDRRHDPAARRLAPWLDWLWAGLLLGLLTWLSFGNAVLMGIVGLHLLWREVAHLWGGGDGELSIVDGESASAAAGSKWRAFGRFAAGAAVLTAGVAAPWLLALLFWNMNYVDLLRVGMAMHYEIVNNGRDLSIWRWMNLVDYALWVGPGVVLLGLVASVWLVMHWRESPLNRNLAGLAVIVWVVILALDLSGSARAEIGRLWIFLMPFPVMFALAYLRTYGLRAALLLMLAVTAWVMGFALRAV